MDTKSFSSKPRLLSSPSEGSQQLRYNYMVLLYLKCLTKSFKNRVCNCRV